MNHKKMLRNQQGFTLIEIIAVLVLLGILAAVAVPKFMDMQGASQGKAVDGALAAASSNVTMSYSQYLLTNSAVPTDITLASGAYTWTGGGTAVDIETDLGDFTATYTFTDPDTTGSNDTVTVLIDTGPTWFPTSAATKNKSFKIQ